MQITTRPYEIKFRFEPSGELAGAHIKLFTVAVDDQNILLLDENGSPKFLKEGPAMTLDQASPEMVAVLGDVLVQTSAQVTALEIDLAGARVQVETQVTAINGLQAQLAVLTNRIEAAAKLVDHVLSEGGGTYGDRIRALGTVGAS